MYIYILRWWNITDSLMCPFYSIDAWFFAWTIIKMQNHPFLSSAAHTEDIFYMRTLQDQLYSSNNTKREEARSVVGTVIQANGRMTFEDDLRSGGLLCFTTQWTSVRKGACLLYGHSGGTRGWLGVERCQLCLQDTSSSAKWHRRAAVDHSWFHCVL